jgi:death-on-curing protein
VSLKSPLFLTVELTMQVHGEMIRAYGGSEGVRDLGLIESAIAQGQNVYLYGAADLFGIAAAYAYHLAESQAFIDGNKRTGAAAALSFLYINGIDISRIDS